MPPKQYTLTMWSYMTNIISTTDKIADCTDLTALGHYLHDLDGFSLSLSQPECRLTPEEKNEIKTVLKVQIYNLKNTIAELKAAPTTSSAPKNGRRKRATKPSANPAAAPAIDVPTPPTAPASSKQGRGKNTAQPPTEENGATPPPKKRGRQSKAAADRITATPKRPRSRTVTESGPQPKPKQFPQGQGTVSQDPLVSALEASTQRAAQQTVTTYDLAMFPGAHIPPVQPPPPQDSAVASNNSFNTLSLAFPDTQQDLAAMQAASAMPPEDWYSHLTPWATQSQQLQQQSPEYPLGMPQTSIDFLSNYKSGRASIQRFETSITLKNNTFSEALKTGRSINFVDYYWFQITKAEFALLQSDIKTHNDIYTLLQQKLPTTISSNLLENPTELANISLAIHEGYQRAQCLGILRPLGM